MKDTRNRFCAVGSTQTITWKRFSSKNKNSAIPIYPRRFASLRKGSIDAFQKAKQLRCFKQYSLTYQKNKLYLEGIYLLNRYGEFLFNQGDNESALTAFLDAVELAPNHAICHNNIGVLYWETGELDKAVDHFSKARKIDPDDRNTVWNCGQIMAITGEYMTARCIYTDYMKHNGYDQEMAQEIASL